MSCELGFAKFAQSRLSPQVSLPTHPSTPPPPLVYVIPALLLAPLLSCETAASTEAAIAAGERVNVVQLCCSFGDDDGTTSNCMQYVKFGER